MGNISFGSAQRNLPTPSNIANLLDTIAGIFGIMIPALNAAPVKVVSADNVLIWTWVLGLMIPILLRLKIYFGVETNQSSVPINQVAEIQEPKKD